MAESMRVDPLQIVRHDEQLIQLRYAVQILLSDRPDSISRGIERRQSRGTYHGQRRQIVS